jgi:hypothetical protein
MKTYLLLIITLISIVFTGCELNGSTNNTPQILFVRKPALNLKDSLNIYVTDEGSVYRLDTISVGDTVSFRVLLNGFSNNLTTCYLSQSDTSATKLLLPNKNSLDSVFLPSSDYSHGKFYFKSNILNLYFPFRYLALKPTNDAKITFSVASDAKFDGSMYLGTNSFNFVLKTPIRNAKPTLPIIN